MLKVYTKDDIEIKEVKQKLADKNKEEKERIKELEISKNIYVKEIMYKYNTFKETQAINNKKIELIKEQQEQLNPENENSKLKIQSLQEEISTIKSKTNIARKEFISSIEDIRKLYIKDIRMWSSPTKEDAEIVRLLKLNLDKNQIIGLIEKNKGSAAAIKEIKKYLIENNLYNQIINEIDKKILVTADDKIESINLLVNQLKNAVQQDTHITRVIENNPLRFLAAFNDTLGDGKELNN